MTEYLPGVYLRGLNDRILELVPNSLHSDIECWMEGIELVINPSHQGRGRDIGYMTYSGIFSFERFPFKKVNTASVMASVMAWLMDNDAHREDFELGNPTCDVEPTSDDTVIMTIEIDFVEPLKVVENPDGDVLWNGKRWSVAEYEIWQAKHVEVGIKR
ncbi:phage tail protein [Vibrio amylolyticus]|uniref:phage tail protein n=1 Tax=Vibrio amylolyticus TaxID=2847292 RepID=UPI00354D53DF